MCEQEKKTDTNKQTLEIEHTSQFLSEELITMATRRKVHTTHTHTHTVHSLKTNNCNSPFSYLHLSKTSTQQMYEHEEENTKKLSVNAVSSMFYVSRIVFQLNFIYYLWQLPAC